MQNKTNNVLKLNEIAPKNVEVKEYKTSYLLNYNGNALNLQLDPLTLSKYGLYPNKSLVDESKYIENKKFNVWIPFDDFTPENLQKLKDLDNYFKTNEKLKKKCSIPETAKYNSIVNENNGYLTLFLKTEYQTSNVTTTFINKNSKEDIRKNTDLNETSRFFKLGNTLQLIITGSIYKYTNNRNNEMYWGVNLKLLTCKFTETDQELSSEKELENANAYFESRVSVVEEKSFLELEPKKIFATLAVNKNNGEKIPVLNFVDSKGTLHFKLPPLVLSTYGTPADELLRDGSKNKYFTGEKNRRSIKIPIPAEEKELVTKFVELDKFIKNSAKIRSVASIDDDNIEKYNPIFRKPLKNKDPNAPIKPNYIKLKFNNRQDVITTKFVLNDKVLDIKTVNDLDEYLRLNMTLVPTIRFGSVWNQVKGDWGVTVQLVSITMTPSASSVVNFVDDDLAQDVDFDEQEVVPDKKNNKKQVVQVDSDDDEAPPVPKKKPSAKKQVVQVESDEDDAPYVPKKKPEPKKQIVQVDSDDEDEKPVVQNKGKGQKQPVKKMDDDDDDDDEIKPVTKKPLAKNKKASA
jgi:hypothetical protein